MGAPAREPAPAGAPEPRTLLTPAPEVSKTMSRSDHATLKDTLETFPKLTSVTKPSWKSRPVKPVPVTKNATSQAPIPPSVLPGFGYPGLGPFARSCSHPSIPSLCDSWPVWVFPVYKIICIALFTIQSLQSNFTGNLISKTDLYFRNSI